MIYATHLALTVFSPTRIDLAWGVVGGPATITQIERSLDNITWAPLTIYYYGLPSFSDTTCSPETSYWYRVRLYETIAGWGPYCAAECAITTELLVAHGELETVVPTEGLAFVFTPHNPAVLGLTLYTTVIPVESFTKVYTPWNHSTVTLPIEVVSPVENLLALKRHYLTPKVLTDVCTPQDKTVVKVNADTKLFTETKVAPIETLTLAFVLNETAYTQDVLVTSIPAYNDDGHGISPLHPFVTSNPWGYWDSKDIDFGFPGVEKTASKVVFWGNPAAPLQVTVSISIDSGETWAWSETVTLERGKLGIVHPWVTGETSRLRFAAYGLALSGFHFTAVPRGSEGPLND